MHDQNFKFAGDAVIIVDMSGSMNEAIGAGYPQPTMRKWDAVQESCTAIAKELDARDPDGITVCFFNDSHTVEDHVTGDHVKELFKKYGPRNGTMLAAPLATTIDMFIKAPSRETVYADEQVQKPVYGEQEVDEPVYEDRPKYKTVKVKKGGFLGMGGTYVDETVPDGTERVQTGTRKVKKQVQTGTTTVTEKVAKGNQIVKHDPERPVFIAVFTDGAAGDQSQVVRTLVDATKRISDRKFLGILFVQVGNDANAAAFLAQVNNDLGDSGGEHDIVAVVKLEDLEDDTPDQTIERAFTE
ncbi:MAG TPA: hypothetical protein V6C81_29010 [Planktothrix sp.]|jgi:hypothetical protein